jgi:hypothetical protein
LAVPTSGFCLITIISEASMLLSKFFEVVVKSTPLVSIDYILVGVIHAFKNLGKTSLEYIEVQSGSYLGEEDIVGFEGLYGRA